MHLAIGTASVKTEVSSPNEKMKKAAEIDPRVSEALTRGIADLTEMAPCHHFAEQALNILRFLAKKWNIEVDIDSGNTPLEDHNGLTKPYTSSLNFFAPNVVTEDFICGWGGTPEMAHALQGSASKAAESIENPLFWPFPMQGRPMLPNGKDLERAGFAMV